MTNILQPAPYPDEYLEYWCDAFVFFHMDDHAVSLDQFLLDPWRYIEDHEAVQTNDHLPLLPQQRNVQLRLDESSHHKLQRQLENDAQVAYRNGTFIEPMHHHAFPRRINRRKGA